MAQPRPGHETGYLAGIRACVDMLGDLGPMSDDYYVIGGACGHPIDRPQLNVARAALGRILMRGDPAELDGFCACLTQMISRADESGDYSREFGAYAERRERVMTRRRRALAARA